MEQSNKKYEVVKSKELSSFRDERFVIIDAETREILDDAQGYGYKTVQNAHRSWAYKNRDKSKDAEKKARSKHIREWMKKHRDFIDDLDAIAFDIVKGSCAPDDKVDTKLVKDLLKQYNLEIDFKPSELLKAWKKF